MSSASIPPNRFIVTRVLFVNILYLFALFVNLLYLAYPLLNKEQFICNSDELYIFELRLQATRKAQSHTTTKTQSFAEKHVNSYNQTIP